MGKFKIVIIWGTTFWLLFSSPASGADDRESRVRINEATQVVKALTAIAEKKITPALLRNADGIAVIPAQKKIALLVGGRYGRGFVSVRDNQGNWTEPFAVNLFGGSVGWQIGAQSTDVVLVFKSRKSIEKVKSGKFTLGMDASVAAGPVGRHLEIDTDPAFEAEIYSYAVSRGLFAGVSLVGAYLKPDIEATEGLYNASFEKVDRGEGIRPVEVKLFLKTLALHTAVKN